MDHVDEFDTSQAASGGVERIKTKHWIVHAFDRAVNLADGIAQVFSLTNRNIDSRVSIEVIDRRFIGTASIYRYGLRNIVVSHGLVKEALGGCGIPP